MAADLDYINRALDLAERGRGTTSPNPMVGALVVRDDGTIVGQGYHERAGGPHAEVRALEEAGELARGASLYVTLEPCCHLGRTGPCVDRVLAAGISRVVASSEDPNPLVSGRGFEFLRRHGIDVVVGPGRERAVKLNRPFFTFMREGRPFVILKAATTLDNRVAPRRGARAQISSAESLRHAHATRAEVDAIGVGSETVLVDDPLLTARETPRVRPLTRVIFDRRLRTPASARLFSTLASGPVIIVTTPESVARQGTRVRDLERAGAQLEPIEERDLGPALRRLGERQILSLLIEGGPTLQRTAAAEGLVDAVHLYLSPATAGSEGVSWLEPGEMRIAALADRRVTPFGPDVFMEGYVHRVD
ncbi:MAG TPA: bifunctional diaminohydroxyphosphoribosylaminopyrimidine deaminase/5-amino-6-(5-phosphoribosylamino)uracil reductase RibD [Vicinamibacterales bacterium]|jgi:diaminohydroxyphosphoribosylaminopyrimidine deaminase/5-amino-6-(5-phosphoribosylamino)uracil reductase|nr:bifunctional diaminohydroxyphosphoribosylaminopyrimidine deaminase/5-amino-6-(5-phosphoribosylamino)uracil reductase RibD [Vicinamibacterales bacterium]